MIGTLPTLREIFDRLRELEKRLVKLEEQYKELYKDFYSHQEILVGHNK